jgi:C-terminal processing protease CtpA/Prc
MRALTRIVLFVLISALVTSTAYLWGYGTGFLLLAPPPQQVSSDSTGHFRAFWEAWRIVQDEHYQAPVDASVLTYGAIRGATEALGDPYTWFADPQEAERIREVASGRYSGIGAVVNHNHEGGVVIVNPF